MVEDSCMINFHWLCVLHPNFQQREPHTLACFVFWNNDWRWLYDDVSLEIMFGTQILIVSVHHRLRYVSRDFYNVMVLTSLSVGRASDIWALISHLRHVGTNQPNWFTSLQLWSVHILHSEHINHDLSTRSHPHHMSDRQNCTENEILCLANYRFSIPPAVY